MDQNTRSEKPSPAKKIDQPKPRRQRAIIVLGMHRSGTSAVGGVVNALGAVGPKTPLAPRADNPRGFFESAPLAIAHDALLASEGSCWDDWRPLPAELDTMGEHREKIKAVLNDEFDGAPLFFVKDPRICRFVPFTLSVLAELNISAVAILPLRNPLEVAYSLKRRNGFPSSKSLVLWLRHVLDSEFHSRQLPRYFLSYERLLVDWRYDMDRAAESMGITWPCGSSSARIEEFLTVDLHHEKATREEIRNIPDVLSLVLATYDIFSAIVANGASADLLGQLDQIRVKVDNDCEIYRWVVERDLLASASGRLSKDRAKLLQATDSLNIERDRLRTARN